MATTFGFSFLQGPHQDAQKSIMVIFPAICFKETTFPLISFAEKSVLHFPAGTGAADASVGVAGASGAGGGIAGALP